MKQHEAKAKLDIVVRALQRHGAIHDDEGGLLLHGRPIRAEVVESHQPGRYLVHVATRGTRRVHAYRRLLDGKGLATETVQAVLVRVAEELVT